MNKHIHIRDMDGKTHRRLTELAELRGLSLTQFLKQELQEIANYSDLQETLKIFQQLPDLKTSMTGAELVREDRDTR